MDKKGEPGLFEGRVYRVRFRYHRPSRYFFLSNNSGYPSAAFRFPNAGPDEPRIMVREIQE
jgi:hypothetical protein